MELKMRSFSAQISEITSHGTKIRAKTVLFKNPGKYAHFVAVNLAHQYYYPIKTAPIREFSVPPITLSGLEHAGIYCVSSRF